MWSALKIAVPLVALAVGSFVGPPASAQEEPIIGFITKNTTIPFFAVMSRGAQEKADELGVDLRIFAAKDVADNASQVDAIENLISVGAKGIVLNPADPVSILPTVEKAKAAGLAIVVVDTPLDPIDATDATLATDNFAAGVLIGQWTAAKLGDQAANARIALIDENINWTNLVLERNQGFLKGFGVEIGDPYLYGDENDPRISGSAFGEASEEPSRTAMENLLQADPELNVVYTINEPSAIGAAGALKAAGKTGVLLVTIDASCPGVRSIAEGVISAEAMQFPLRMAAEGVQTIVDHINGGALVTPSEGLQYTDTGTTLVTNDPVEGVDSISTEEALEICWE